ncbi:hypothetical protein [Streptomyces sp. NPDC003717]|uniref:hypothetical protein n=1 Tax=Streptomyces sp. NPDC003717 TaxID=3154276 RepID=UPI0033B67745
MSWTRRAGRRSAGTALAVCALLAAAAGCGSRGADESPEGTSSTSAGRPLGTGDEDGRRHREAAAGHPLAVGVEVQPDDAGGWQVRLTVRGFRFSPPGTAPSARGGRGTAHLFVDGRPVAHLHGPDFRLAAAFVPRGTHHVTARLHADDGAVWTVDGRPVQSTADITSPGPLPGNGGHGAPDRGGRRS